MKPKKEKKTDFDKLHDGRYSGSNLGCEMGMALRVMGYKPTISKKLRKIFDLGHEHDLVMKEEAEEEFDDYYLPKSKVIVLRRGKTRAEVVLSPDGLRDDEVIEFKGLSPSNFNSIKTVQDLKGGKGLFQKYYNQVQIYAGGFKKPIIRFRIKNKKNLKVKDLLFKFNPKIYNQLKNKIMDVQEILDKGRFPTEDCSSAERKYCYYSSQCRGVQAKISAEQPKVKLSSKIKRKLFQKALSYLEVSRELKAIEAEKDGLKAEIKLIMRSHGQKEISNNEVFVKFGVRYKNYKDAEAVEKLVESGKIPVTEVPEEYLSVSPEGGEWKNG